MSEPQPIPFVRDIYARMLRDDLDALVELVTPDAVYDNPEDAMEAGVRQGRSEFEVALRNIVGDIQFSEITVQRGSGMVGWSGSSGFAIGSRPSIR